MSDEEEAAEQAAGQRELEEHQPEDDVLALLDRADEVQEDPMERAIREAEAKALEIRRDAVAGVLYDRFADSIGVASRWKGVEEEVKVKFHVKAKPQIDEVIDGRSVQVGPPGRQQTVQPPSGRAPEAPLGGDGETLPSVFGGDARGGGFEWEPSDKPVILEVRRGNMGTAIKLPPDTLHPAQNGTARVVLENIKQGFLMAQQHPQDGGQPANQPLHPDREYAVQLAPDRVVDVEGGFVIEDFSATHPDEGLPFIVGHLIDYERARVDARGASGPERPVGLGNPVVIGGGKVLGVPVQVNPEGASPGYNGQPISVPGAAARTGPPQRGQGWDPGAARV